MNPLMSVLPNRDCTPTETLRFTLTSTLSSVFTSVTSYISPLTSTIFPTACINATILYA